MEGLNTGIERYCGKDFEFGQGYFWSLVSASGEYHTLLADVLRNKLYPHLRDVLPSECLGDFFGATVADILYTTNEYGYDFAELSFLPDPEIINAFAESVGSDYRCDEETAISYNTFDEYESHRISMVFYQLLHHKNVIIEGVSGTGKSYVVNKIAQNGYFSKVSTMYWHNSTDYSDTIEGISAVTEGGSINYSVLPGMIKQLADDSIKGPKLMIIEGVTKSNPAENFGELITLLEPDKRRLSIQGLDGEISIPDDMFFICTSNPADQSNHKLDSALKRRFVISSLEPDPTLLALHLNVIQEEVEFDKDSITGLSSYKIKQLAVLLLCRINESIKEAVGNSYQLGHSIFWKLDENSNFGSLVEIIDYKVLPLLEDICADLDIAKKVFGETSPVVHLLPYGVELRRISSMTPSEQYEVMKGLLTDE